MYLEIKIYLYVHGRKAKRKGRGRQENNLYELPSGISVGMLSGILVLMCEGRRKKITLVYYVLQILISVYILVPTY